MNTVSYFIRGGDYDHAGAATRNLKERLKRIGADPAGVRRAVIAAYEAETNVVIHATQGVMRARFDPQQIEIEVADEGPGIPDIGLAMKEGFSTAPPKARELGFGAGLGLPNIRKNSDQFAIESVVGKGTKVHIVVYFSRSSYLAASQGTAIRVRGEFCRACLRCVRRCPTGALRVRDTRPQILEHLCIGCGVCLSCCPTGALVIAGETELARPQPGSVLVLPGAFLVQFGPQIDAPRVLAALAALGFAEILLAEYWLEGLRAAVRDFAEWEASTHPVIAPLCPAVVNLAEMRFPALLGNLAPFLSPLEAAREELAGSAAGKAVFAIACPAQRTLLQTVGTDLANLNTIRHAIAPLLGSTPSTQAHAIAAKQEAPATAGVLVASGIAHVMNTLEAAENNQLSDVRVLELFACEGGCFGSSLLREDPLIARYRWSHILEIRQGTPVKRGVRRQTPYTPRPGLRLDPDMTKAMEKLARIDEWTRRLPGRDCACCGAPTCAACAEDIVLGRVGRNACLWLQSSAPQGEAPSEIK